VVKLRLQRIGKKKFPYYKIVAVDSRSKRDGDIIEAIGQYQPVSQGEQVKLDEEKVIKWLKNGAQPSDTIKSILKKSGILAKV